MKTDLQISALLLTAFLLLSSGCKKDDYTPIVEPEPEVIADNLLFAEGPAFLNGNLYISDIQANKIYAWNEKTGLQVFMENSGGANGLYFDSHGNLIVCQGTARRIVSVNSGREITVITDKFGNATYNEPNDLWISTTGNIYFTDPVFSGTLSQPGENVYCVLAATGNVIKIISDLVKPNGIIGNTSGTVLYVADYGDSKIYSYSIQTDGTVTGKTLFAAIKADGLCIDNDGNIYAAGETLLVFNPQGKLIKSIPVPGTITNVCITETGVKTAFITTHNAVYRLIIN
jgi:gluconolactonase